MEKMNPLISVIIPVYNASMYIEDTLNSVLNQSYDNYEIIAIDDCSLDDSFEILKKIKKKDERVRIYKNEKNMGVSKTRNYGIEKAKGNWIAFLDSDDIWLENKLEVQVNAINEKTDRVLFYTASYYMNNDGKMYSYILEAKEDTDFNTILRNNIISCSAIVVRKDIISQFLMSGDDKLEDFVAWLSITKQYGSAYGINIPLIKYRITQNSRSSSKIKNFARMINSLRYIGFSFFKSLIYTLLYAQFSILNKRKIHNNKSI